MVFASDMIFQQGNLSVSNNALYVNSILNMTGIGTSSPDTRFTLQSPSGASGIKNLSSIKNAVGNSRFFLQYDIDNVRLYLTNRNEDVILSVHEPSGGRVGIGTLSPSVKLEVNGTGNITGKLYLNNTDVSTWLYNETIASGWNKSGNNLFPGNLNDKVGIGMSTPTANLTVIGDTSISVNLNVSNTFNVNNTNLYYGGNGANLSTIYFNGRISGVQESIIWDDDLGSNFIMRRTNKPTTAGQRLGLFGAGGFDGNISTSSVFFNFLSSDNWNTTSHPSELTIQVTGNNSISTTNAIQIGSNGHTSIGGDVSTPSYWLSVIRSTNAMNVSDVLYVDGSSTSGVGIGRGASSISGGVLNVYGNVNITKNITVDGFFVYNKSADTGLDSCTLVAGACTISNKRVTAKTVIICTEQNLGTVTLPQGVGVTARTAGSQYTIKSSSATDTSWVACILFEPA